MQKLNRNFRTNFELSTVYVICIIYNQTSAILSSNLKYHLIPNHIKIRLRLITVLFSVQYNNITRFKLLESPLLYLAFSNSL